MVSIEGIKLPAIVDRRSLHVADIAIETVEFLDSYAKNPTMALTFWDRIRSEYTENGQGYSDQEFEELSWHANHALGLLEEVL